MSCNTNIALGDESYGVCEFPEPDPRVVTQPPG